MLVPMEKAEKQVVAYTAAAHGWVHVLELAFAAVLASVALEFRSGLFLLGIITNIFAFAFGAGALPAGLIADKIGSRRLLLITFLLAALFCLLVGFSPTLPLLGLALAGLGIALSFYHPAGLSFIARGVRQQAMGFAYHGMGGTLGIAAAPLLAGSIAAVAGWRAAYLALVPFTLALAFLARFAPDQGREGAGPSSSPAQTAGRGGLGSALPALLIIYTASTLNGLVYRGMVTFLPLYFLERVQVRALNIDSVALAGSFATFALFFGILGQYVGGWLAQRVNLEPLVVALALAIIPPLFLMGVASGVPVVLFASVVAFFQFMNQPAYNSLVAKYTPRELQGSSYGVSFFCTFGLGSFAAGFSGYIAERLGTPWVFITLAGVGVVLLLFTLLLLWRSRGWVPAAVPAQ